MIINSDHEFVMKFVEMFPELGPLLDEHLIEQEGELLPYLFMGDLTRLVVDAWGDRERHGLAKRLISALEDSYRNGQGSVRDLIAAGFVENLPYPSRRGDAVRSGLGPQLRSVWNQTVGRA